MPIRLQLRSLLLQSILWIAVPIGLVLLGAILTGTFAYQQVVTSLLMDRDRQLAVLSAARISESLEGYALLLETYVQTSGLQEGLQHGSASVALDVPEDILTLFTAGIVVSDRSGSLIAASPATDSAFGDDVSNEPHFIAVRQGRKPVFSDVVGSGPGGKLMIIVGIPILDETRRLQGTLLAGTYLRDSPLGEFVLRLDISDDEFAYLVDGRGRAIFHPESQMLGADLSERPFVERVITGESGGMIWDPPSGDRLVLGYAPVEGTSWGLVVREPWETVVAPVRAYGTALGIASGVVVLIAGILLSIGVRRITKPIGQLAAETRNLWQQERVSALDPTGIREIDALAQAFNQMAERVASYRAGLRRYIGAVTQTQEEERLRIARDLHDETIQGLLAIQRQLELYPTLEKQEDRQSTLDRVRDLLNETILGLRVISREMRPFMLEDLGLIPALRSLLHPITDRGSPAFLSEVEIKGQPRPLTREQELALYRITQEALANIHKHALATRVRVEISFDPGAVVLTICDDGQGFELPPSLSALPHQDSYGLMGIQERAWGVGGDLSIKTAPGEGTEIRVNIPTP